jgi:hypothetical protein
MNGLEATQYIIEPVPAPPTKRILRPINGGANRGARENRTAFADFNRDSTQAVIEPRYVDTVPGRAAAFAEESRVMGIFSRALEGRVEDIVLAEKGTSNDPIILNLDRASAIANVLRTTASAGRPTLGYLLLKLPSERLWAVRFVLEADNDGARLAAIAFFERLAEVSERNTSSSVLGEQADPAHLLIEPRIREWFAEHTKANLAKLVAGVEPATNTFEVTNGHDTLPLIISVRDEWSEPLALAEEVLANPSIPIRRGMQFVLAEVTGEGIRFHEVRRRTDDRLTVGRAEVIDRNTMAARIQAEEEAASREEQRRQAQEALARAVRETLSRRNPVQTTD